MLAERGEWNAVLAQYKVPSLHMSDYIHSKGAFASWKGDEQMRAAFLDALVRVIQRNVNKVFGIGIMLADWNAVNARYRLAETYGDSRPDAGAYALCAETCKSLVTNWISQRKGPPLCQHSVRRCRLQDLLSLRV